MPDFPDLSDVSALLFDLDGTATRGDALPADAYAALERAHDAGLKTLAVTGRPAGWCDMIARWWPVDGVIGENGAFCFRRRPDGSMARDWITRPTAQERTDLHALLDAAIAAVPGSAPAEDNAWRVCDLALDFAEAVERLPLESAKIAQSVFEAGGATAKISHIHVNAWFGHHDKRSTALRALSEALDIRERERVAYIGDSPNDAPMFEAFPLSFGVSGVRDYLSVMDHAPAHILDGAEADGFIGLIDRLVTLRETA